MTHGTRVFFSRYFERQIDPRVRRRLVTNDQELILPQNIILRSFGRLPQCSIVLGQLQYEASESPLAPDEFSKVKKATAQWRPGAPVWNQISFDCLISVAITGILDLNAGL